MKRNDVGMETWRELAMDEETMGMILAVVLLGVILLVAVLVVLMDGVDGDARKNVGDLEQAAAEAAEQDEMAEPLVDSAMKAYLFSGRAVAAHAQAGDKRDYLLWEGIVEKGVVGNGKTRQ